MGRSRPAKRPSRPQSAKTYEETGWRIVGPVRHLSTHHPSVGLVNQTFSIFVGEDVEHEGLPPDANEAVRVEWRTFEQVAADVESGEISDAFGQLAVTLALATIGRGDVLIHD